MSEQVEEIPLEQMLEARERRATRQQALLRPETTLISFSMNIAGPVKTSPLIRRGFTEGCALLREVLRQKGIPCLKEEISSAVTGEEGFFLLDAEPLEIKKLTIGIEEQSPIGRLFDIDVLRENGAHVSRAELGVEDRGCFICGIPGRRCASRRLHSLEQLQAKTSDILESYFLKADLDQIASLASRALLYEVCTTPKPGLVDRENNGSHRDMDIFLFIDSVTQLTPFFRQCAETGWTSRTFSPEESFSHLRTAGQLAEYNMFRTTNGINTHKGAIFSMGTVCGALGRLRTDEGLCSNAARVLEEVSAMTHAAMSRELSSMGHTGAVTAGERQYQNYGITGIRGQVAQGLPAVLQVGLPWLHKALDSGKSINDAGVIALLHLIASVTDTNLIARSDLEVQQQISQQIQALLSTCPLPDRTTAQKLDAQFIEKNLSPGGCADLLAISYLLLFLERTQTAPHIVYMPDCNR